MARNARNVPLSLLLMSPPFFQLLLALLQPCLSWAVPSARMDTQSSVLNVQSIIQCECRFMMFFFQNGSVVASWIHSSSPQGFPSASVNLLPCKKVSLLQALLWTGAMQEIPSRRNKNLQPDFLFCSYYPKPSV